MIRRHAVVLIAAAALAAPAWADEIGPAMPGSPAAVEAVPPPVPFTVRQEDAEAIFRRAPPPSAPVTPPPAAGGTTEEIALDPAPVVNQTPHFVFVDETERPVAHVRSMPERQAAVEAARQSLRGGR